MSRMHSDSSRRRAFLTGARRCTLLVPSFIPFGLICGIAAMQVGLGEWGAAAMGTLVYAGSSQAVLTQFLGSGAPLWVVIASGLVVNLRMAIYSAALSADMRPATRRQRMLWAAFLVDQTFLMHQVSRARNEFPGHELAFYLGATAVLWPAWIATNVTGAIVGSRIPASLELEFTIPLSFVAIVVPTLKSAPAIAAALAGGAASMLLFSLPLKLGLIAGCLTGALAGVFVDHLLTRD